MVNPQGLSINESSYSKSWLRILGLSALLIIVAYLIGGFYYDSNDDPALRFLVQGITAAQPISNLSIYYLGWSSLLAALYAWSPTVLWYDILLTGLIYAGLACSFYIIECCMRSCKWAWRVVLIEVLFFIATYMLHLFQMNFTRPALLLGGCAGLLITLPITARRITIVRWLVAILLFLAGWGIRPIGADLGLLLTMPLLLLGSRKQLVLAVTLLTIFVGGLTVWTKSHLSSESQQYIRINDIRTNIFDYHRYELKPHTYSDTLAAFTLGLGQGPYDRKLVNEDFFRRCLEIKPAPSLQSQIRKLVITISDLIKQWQPIALVLLFLLYIKIILKLRGDQIKQPKLVGVFIVYQAFFWFLYIAIGFYFHPVPRVAQPMISVYLLGNIFLFTSFSCFEFSLLPSRTWIVVLASTLVITFIRDYRIINELATLEQKNDNYLKQLQLEAAGTTIVGSGMHDILNYLHLFKSYGFGSYKRVLMLGGWSIYDPSQPDLRRYLTGKEDVSEALLALGKQSRVTWLMEPNYAVFLEKYLNFSLHSYNNRHISLVLIKSALPSGYGPQRYVLHEAILSPSSVPYSVNSSHE